MICLVRPMLFSEKPPLHVPLWGSRNIDRLAYSSLETFCSLAALLIPWFAAAAVIGSTAGLYFAFFVAPVDAQHGEVYRVIFIHVPAVWTAIFICLAMAFWAGVGIAFNTRFPAMIVQALAPTGAMFTFLALWTGSLWGKPAWGVWFVWDARFTSELVLLFLYFGFMLVPAVVGDPRRADQTRALLAAIGVVDISIICFSVLRWSTLHQGVSAGLEDAPAIAGTFFAGMIVTAVGFATYSAAVALSRARCIVLEHERDAEWVAEYVRTLR